MSEKKTDRLYRNPAPIYEDFNFNEQVAEVFDDMLARSVPCYSQVIGMTASLLSKFLVKGDSVFDMGCATGNTLLQLSRRLSDLELRFTGLDNSPAMIAKAQRKTEMFTGKQQLNFVEADIFNAGIHQGGAIILNYTLQFIRPMQRLDFLKRLYGCLRPGGILIISEKTVAADSLLNRAFIDFYLQFKKKQGYSELEIARKREALENVLIPFTIEENRKMVEQAGFSTIETFFQWFNFTSFVAVK